MGVCEAITPATNPDGALGVCRYVYLDSSVNEPGGVYQAEMSIYWDLNGIGSDGTVINRENFAVTEATADIRVAEARTVVVNPSES